MCKEPVILFNWIFSSLCEITRTVFTQAPSRKIWWVLYIPVYERKNIIFDTFSRYMDILVFQVIAHSAALKLNQILLGEIYCCRYNAG